MSETEKSTGMVAVVERRGDIAIAAMAAKSKAEVEARYVIAMQRPRNVMAVRDAVLSACKRPAFCQGAIYRKPVGGGKTVDGFSIRFAEEAVKSMKNIAIDTMAIYEDEERLTIRISVTDLESNTTYADEARITKTVERRNLKEGQEAISKRTNSTGQITYLVAATDDDLLNKINAAKSKAIRNSGLRLIPQDILEEAWNQIIDTMETGGKDTQADVKKVCDAFSALGVKPKDIEQYLGHSLESVTPKEITGLRGIYTAIKEEETTWKSVMESVAPKRPANTGPAESIDVAGTVSTINSKAPVLSGEALVNAVLELMKKDDVSEAQVLVYCKSMKPPICKPTTIEVPQMADDSLRLLHTNWKHIVNNIQAVKVVTGD